MKGAAYEFSNAPPSTTVRSGVPNIRCAVAIALLHGRSPPLFRNIEFSCLF